MKTSPLSLVQALTVGARAGATPPASALTRSAQGVPGKAHRPRPQAQKETVFKDYVRGHAKDKIVDDAESPFEKRPVAAATAGAKGREGAAPERPAERQDTPEGQQEEASPSGATKRPADAGGEGEQFVDGVVEQVLAAVDPALRSGRLQALRAASTVSGQAARAMRRGSGQSAAEPAVANEPSQGDSSGSGAPVKQPFEPVPAGSSEGRIDIPPGMEASSGEQEPARASTGGTERADRAAPVAAVLERSAAAVLQPLVNPVSPRPALTPTLSLATSGIGYGSGAAVPLKPGAAQPPASARQQIQQALEVAMYELPAPAGERLVTLRLNPSSLGSLRIALQVNGGTVNVRFQVGSAKARAAIDRSLDDLRASIDRQGLRIGAIEVEEDRALAAPAGPGLDENGRGASPAPGSPGPAEVGKGFANLLDTPPGHSSSGTDQAQGSPPDQAAPVGEEGGVLQVLTFRLNAVG